MVKSIFFANAFKLFKKKFYQKYFYDKKHIFCQCFFNKNTESVFMVKSIFSTLNIFQNSYLVGLNSHYFFVFDFVFYFEYYYIYVGIFGKNSYQH